MIVQTILIPAYVGSWAVRQATLMCFNANKQKQHEKSHMVPVTHKYQNGSYHTSALENNMM